MRKIIPNHRTVIDLFLTTAHPETGNAEASSNFKNWNWIIVYFNVKRRLNQPQKHKPANFRTSCDWSSFITKERICKTG